MYNLPQIIDKYTKDFVGREWIFSEIGKWLSDPNGASFFIISGEPGIGKTAIIARLTQNFDVAAVHFCITRQADTSDPIAFARSLSHQLSRIGEFAQAILSETDIHIDVRIDVQQNYGNIIAIQIENLLVDSRTSPNLVFSRLVIEPLKKIYKNGFDQQLIILIDALDEAIQYSEDSTLVDMLANAEGLPFQVRFIITSRIEKEVLRYFERNANHLVIDASGKENLLDAQRYIQHYLDSSKELQKKLTEADVILPAFIDRTLAASQGNFLYLHWLLSSIITGTQRPHTFEGLPTGLDGIYREYLRMRKVGRTFNRWRSCYRPLLGVLAAAKSPLSLNQLQQFTGLKKQKIIDFLVDIQQFLEPLLVPDHKYRLYHHSVAEFLSSQEEAQEFWIDTEESHQEISSHLLHDQASWLNSDGLYAIQHLCEHLIDANRIEDLYELLDTHEWRYASLKSDPSGTQLIADLEKAFKSAKAQGARGLPRLFALSLYIATIRTATMRIPHGTLGLLVRVGQTQQAFRHAYILEEPHARFDALCEIAESLSEAQEYEVAQFAIHQGLNVLQGIPEDSERSLSLRISKIIDISVVLNYVEGIKHAYAIMQDSADDNWLKIVGSATTLSAIAEGFAKLGCIDDLIAIANNVSGWKRLLILCSSIIVIPREKEYRIMSLINDLARELLHNEMVSEPDHYKVGALQKYLSVIVAYDGLDKVSDVLAQLEDPIDRASSIFIMVRDAKNKDWALSEILSALSSLNGLQQRKHVHRATSNVFGGMQWREEPSEIDICIAEAVISLVRIGNIYGSFQLAIQMANVLLQKAMLLTVVQQVEQIDGVGANAQIMEDFLQFLSLFESDDDMLEKEIKIDLSFRKQVILEMSLVFAKRGEQLYAEAFLEMALHVTLSDSLRAFVEIRRFSEDLARSIRLKKQSISPDSILNTPRDTVLDTSRDDGSPEDAALLPLIGQVYLRLGKTSDVQAILGKILSNTFKPIDADARTIALASIGTEIARAAKSDECLSIINYILQWKEKQKHKVNDLASHFMWEHVTNELDAQVAGAFVYLGQHDHALAMADDHPYSSGGKKPLYEAMAIAYAHMRNYEMVNELIREASVMPPPIGEIDFNASKQDTEIEVINIMARNGDFDHAIHFVDKIGNNKQWVGYLSIAEMMSINKQSDKALFFKKALEGTVNFWQRLIVAQSLVRAEEIDQLRIMLPTLKTFFSARDDLVSLAYVGELFAKVGEHGEAKEIIETVLRLAKLSDEESPDLLSGGLKNARILAGTAVAAYSIGDLFLCRKLFDQAVASAYGVLVCSPGDRQFTWRCIANCFAAIGDIDRAFMAADSVITLGDRKLAYREIVFTLVGTHELLAKFGLYACQIGMERAKNQGRDNYWMYVQSFIPLLTNSSVDINELWERIKRVEVLLSR